MEKAGLKLNIKETKVMASSSITSWQIDGEKVGTVADFIFLGSKITVDGDCSHEIKRTCSWKEGYDKLIQHNKKQRYHLLTKVHIAKAVFPVVMYGCEIWAIKKAEFKIIDALKLQCRRKLLRVPWTARRSNQSAPTSKPTVDLSEVPNGLSD